MVRGTYCTFDTNTTDVLTRRGEPIDQATSVVTGASCGYLLCQFFTIAYYWREKAFKSKQPHVLLPQTLAAGLFLMTVLIEGGHFYRGDGWFSVCVLWDVWCWYLAFGTWISCNVLRVIKVHRVRVGELSLSAAVARSNARRSGREGACRKWMNTPAVKFYRQLVAELLPWLTMAAAATAFEAKCLSEAKGQCVYNHRFFLVFLHMLVLWPCLRMALLGCELSKLGTKSVFVEFVLLRRVLALLLCIMGLNALLHFLRSYTAAGDAQPFRIAKRNIITLMLNATIVYWQHTVIGEVVWCMLTDREAFRRHVEAATAGGVGTRRFSSDDGVDIDDEERDGVDIDIDDGAAPAARRSFSSGKRRVARGVHEVILLRTQRAARRARATVASRASMRACGGGAPAAAPAAAPHAAADAVANDGVRIELSSPTAAQLPPPGVSPPPPPPPPPPPQDADGSGGGAGDGTSTSERRRSNGPSFAPQNSCDGEFLSMVREDDGGGAGGKESPRGARGSVSQLGSCASERSSSRSRSSSAPRRANADAEESSQPSQNSNVFND